MRLACSGLFSWCERGARIVTPSRFLAEVADEQLAREQFARGISSWQRTPVYNVNAWLSALWSEARYKSTDLPTLLSASQEHALWRQIIESRHSDLFDPASTAHLAVRAAKLIAEWHIPTEGDAWNDHEDARQFQHWYKTFRQRCRERGWITRSDIWRLLPKWIADGMCTRELTVFTGFETFSPALEKVKQALGLFTAIEEIDSKNGGCVAAGQQACEDLSEELELAARWARARFEQNHAVSIGIFVPDLARQRALVERTFDRTFYPSAILKFADIRRDFEGASQSARSVFHISRAAPLPDHPLIASALLLLELGHPRIAIADAGAILRCPFIEGAASEASARALADVALRKHRDLDVALRDLEFAARECPSFTRLCSGVRRVLSRKTQQLEFANWSELFTDLLKAVGWPGDRESTRERQEVVDTWNETLSTLAALGLVSAPVPYNVALGHLRRLLSRPGLERGEWSSPVQIVDSSDASALQFDCVSVTGLSDQTWPPPIETHPLIPLKLQRACGIPGSSPEAARYERQRITEWLFRAAPVTIATYSGRLAPIAERFMTSGGELSLWSGKLPRDSYAAEPLLELEDWTAPAYQQMQPAKGGTAVVKAQSQCPFRAFAEYRLNAQRPEDACFGFDARDRGKFLHKTLEHVWKRLETQHRLRSSPDEELRVIVQDAVTQAVKENRQSPFHELITATERERLEDLVLEWLVEIERKRPQPFAVENIEHERLVTIGGLALNLRVDRIDRLKNGSVLLIDYKSGAQSRKKLECPRPPEPQLWVYAAAAEDRVDGVFFAEMKQRNARSVGFSREKHFKSTSVTVKGAGWNSFLTECTDEVRRIAADFVAGNAAVDPIRNACQYCNVKPFCRVNEGTRQEQDEE